MIEAPIFLLLESGILLGYRASMVTTTPEVTLANEWQRSPRRLRIKFNDVWVADSTRAMLLRQHGFQPIYYFPAEDVRVELLEPSDYTTHSNYKGTASYSHLSAGDRCASNSVWTYLRPRMGSPDTRGYYGFDWHSMDAWFEEATRIYVHARDPFLRVDAVPSTRHVCVEVAGTAVADSKRPVLLFETGLVTRFYLPPEDVRLDLLEPSDAYTMCPYKGRASYHHLKVADAVVENVTWQYRRPLPDVCAVAGHFSFWNENDNVKIVVDSAVMPRLGTRNCPMGGEKLTPQREFWTVPPPARLAGSSYQTEARRPNGRAEGPCDDVMDMRVERAGGRPQDWLDHA